ncbi:hypothetical protein NL676_026159 [Syzygium grande]|nr:hypothetical protein NL676_026159 [Syzygium grande]
MEAVEKWRQLLELLAVGFPSLARDPKKERMVKGLLPEMDIAPMAGFELHRQYELFSLLFPKGLEAYKLKIWLRSKRRRAFVREPSFSKTVLPLSHPS